MLLPRVLVVLGWAVSFLLFATTFNSPAAHHHPLASMQLHQIVDPRETYECAVPKWVETFEAYFGGHVVEVVVLLYLFVGTAVVIDSYFVPSLEFLMATANIPQDVIGATFLSFANASPEIFVSIVSTARTGKVRDGVSAVLGSVACNLLVVPAVCIGVVQSTPLRLSWQVMCRDMIVFAAVLTAMVIIFAQGQAGLPESVVLLTVYPLYMTFLFVVTKTTAEAPADSPKGAEETEALLPSSNRSPRYNSENRERSETWKVAIWIAFVLTWFWEKLFGLLFLKRIREMFVLTFVLSMVCILLLSLGVLVLVKRLECGLEIDGDLLGLTLVGIGLTIPNMLSDGLMSKQGYTDLAFSSVLNSSVAAILIGIAGPWTVLNLINGAPVKLQSPALGSAVLLLAVCFVLFALSLIASGWAVGYVHLFGSLALYVTFLVLILTHSLHGLGDTTM